MSLLDRFAPAAHRRPERPASAAPPETGAALEFRAATKRFGAAMAVNAVDLAVPTGSFFTLLGPSGCGKTTLLRMAGGFVTPDGGRVTVGGVDVTRMPPHRRGLGFVFQSYALFPTKTVAENMGFALALRGTGRAEVAARIAELSRLVGLSGLEDRYPHELSGGQQQRVALARALAPNPSILLLDEPLSALDAEIRARLREEMRRIVEEIGITTVYVTHDQEEALSISDRIAVMRDGRILQIGVPSDVYLHPTHAFVARFVGIANVVPCQVAGPACVDCAGGMVATRPIDPDTAQAARTVLTWRPEHCSLRQPGGGLPARLTGARFLGPAVRLTLRLATGAAVTVDRPVRDWLADPLEPGAEMALAIDPAFATVLAQDDAVRGDA